MVDNKIQFQKSLNLPRFLSYYGQKNSPESLCSKCAGLRDFVVPCASISAMVKLLAAKCTNATNAISQVLRLESLSNRGIQKPVDY